MSGSPTVRLDLRAVLAVAALVVIVLVIIFVEIFGREDVGPLVDAIPTAIDRGTATPVTPVPTSTPGPTPTPAPPTATSEPEPGGAERDETRIADLTTIGQALEEYREENGSYPDSGGNVQTLCVFPDSDIACELEDVLSPIPNDPLGEPRADNGYWYASDGNTFTVYAQRESEQFDSCPERPDHLRQFDSVLCVQGP